MGERDFTEAEYAAAIPSCCSHQGIEEHMAMMLCWGLSKSLQEGKPMNCSGCDENVNNWTPEKRESLRKFRESAND